MPYKAIDIAKYVINKCTVEQHPISNLQLQKILFYIQKAFLESNMLAFIDEFEAWQFGPVVPEVYYLYCGFGSLCIRMKYQIELPSNYLAIMNPIIETKRLLNPWNMVEDTHRPGKAWDQIYNNGLGNHKTIPNNLIKNLG